MDIDIHHVDRNQALLTCGALVLRIVDNAPTDFADIDRVIELHDQLCQSTDRVGVLVVIHHGTPPPSVPVLRHMAGLHGRFRKRGALVFVMLGLGFWAMAAHGAVRVLSAYAGVSIPVETDIDAAAAYLATHIPALDADAVIAAYEHGANRMIIHGPGR